MFSLAHISDIHLGPLPRVRPADLTGKRFIGYHSWQYRRRHIHRPEILEAVITDMLAHQPDHIAVTGDLINIGLASEYRLAAEWLEALGEPDQITFVPGNHDAYVPFPWDTGIGLWADYMTGDMRVAGAHGMAGLAAPFPFVRQRRNVALIGASSAVPMGWRLAAGRLGMPQIEALRQILRELRTARFFPHSADPPPSAPRSGRGTKGAGRRGRPQVGAAGRRRRPRSPRPQPPADVHPPCLGPWTGPRDRGCPRPPPRRRAASRRRPGISTRCASRMSRGAARSSSAPMTRSRGSSPPPRSSRSNLPRHRWKPGRPNRPPAWPSRSTRGSIPTAPAAADHGYTRRAPHAAGARPSLLPGG
jgi:hypothetical protein